MARRRATPLRRRRRPPRRRRPGRAPPLPPSRERRRRPRPLRAEARPPRPPVRFTSTSDPSPRPGEGNVRTGPGLHIRRRRTSNSRASPFPAVRCDLPGRPFGFCPADSLPEKMPRDDLPGREDALALVHEYTASDSLRKHMLAVETAMRAYAEHFGEDVERWGLT